MDKIPGLRVDALCKWEKQRYIPHRVKRGIEKYDKSLGMPFKTDLEKAIEHAVLLNSQDESESKEETLNRPKTVETIRNISIIIEGGLEEKKGA